MTKRIPLAVGLAAFAMACSDPTMSPTRTLVTGGVDAAVNAHPINFSTGGVYPANLADGVVRLCKVANAAGSFEFTWSLNGGAASAIPGGPLVVTTPNTPVCRTIYTSTVVNQTAVETIVITEAADQTNWALTGRTVDQYFGANVSYPAPRLSDADNTGARSVTVYTNDDMAKLVTFTNTFTAPPETPICDFITFGRLVWEHDGLKVVISGNAGGNAPDGGFLNEFHIEVNGVDHHVADITSYGPIAAAPLASSTYTNSRRAVGIDKDGHAVELRVWDGGEPGWKYDRFWFNVNGTIVGNATTGNLIDQGNMQYHPNCRGPGN